MILIKKRKKTFYLLQKEASELTEITKEKETLHSQGYLVITIIEGSQKMEQGLEAIIRNHFH